MANKIVLISDDLDFFEYIKSKLELRKSDEVYSFNFDEIPEKLHLLSTSVIIVNSENSNNKTLDLLNLFKSAPIIVIAYNNDDNFKKKCYRAGAIDYISLLTTDSEFRVRLLPALKMSGILQKNQQYRDMLVSSDVVSEINEVFLGYEQIIHNEIKKIQAQKIKSVFAAISPADKEKLKISSNNIETVILNNIRKNDILMNFAPNKYFLILFNTDIISAQKLWNKIAQKTSCKIYAGLSAITNQSREQLVNDALNKLHEAINYDKTTVDKKNEKPSPISCIGKNVSDISNFKIFRQEFCKKIEQIIAPVFYQTQQKYLGKLVGLSIEQKTYNGSGDFYVYGKYSSGTFKITSPGFSKINIDITCQKDSKTVDSKRITLDPEELEAGLLQDLLEQFIIEYKNEVLNDS